MNKASLLEASETTANPIDAYLKSQSARDADRARTARDANAVYCAALLDSGAADVQTFADACTLQAVTKVDIETDRYRIAEARQKANQMTAGSRLAARQDAVAELRHAANAAQLEHAISVMRATPNAAIPDLMKALDAISPGTEFAAKIRSISAQADAAYEAIDRDEKAGVRAEADLIRMAANNPRIATAINQLREDALK